MEPGRKREGNEPGGGSLLGPGQKRRGIPGARRRRLPDAKELQSPVDYGRSPAATGSVAVAPIFQVTEIVNEAGQRGFPAFWTSTTHANSSSNPGGYAVYVSLSRAMGYVSSRWVDVHGAGAQRRDPKAGDPGAWPGGQGGFSGEGS